MVVDGADQGLHLVHAQPSDEHRGEDDDERGA